MNAINAFRVGVWCQNTRQLRIFKNTLKQHYSTESEKITIPKRIDRNPTDILQALASTVQRDPTAPHYKYHDDPYLIPMSNAAKRSYALSKESGKKAAQWVKAQSPELFQHKVAYPPIEVYAPRVTYDENSEVNEEVLLRVIDDVLISDAIMIYQLLQKKGESISDSTKQSLLEFLCFYNCEDTLPEDVIEERWLRQLTVKRGRQRKTWNDGSLAENIFRSLESPGSAAYCALLQGMARFHQIEGAWRLYEEMQEKRISLTADAYSSLIRVTCFLREGNELRWQFIQELLTNMSKQSLKPNIGTLNAVLEAISGMGLQKHVRTFALKALAEFREVGVEPSLASYYFLLITFCKEKGPVNPILIDIMDKIEGQTFTIQDPKDTFFFVTAMDNCRNHLQDLELAHRVNNLLHVGNNYNLIGDSYKESVYYRNYFMILCNMEPLEVFMEYYNKFVPHIYVPEPAVMEDVVKVVDLNGAAEYFPKLWSDMMMFDQMDRDTLLSCLLNGMVNNEPIESSDLSEKFATIVSSAWEKLEVEVDQDKYRNFRWTGEMLGNMVILCLRGHNFYKAVEILNKLEKDENTIVGVPKVETLFLFIDNCITEKDINAGIKCIKYFAEAGFSEAGKCAQQLASSLELNEEQMIKLTNIVGQDILQAEKNE